MKSSDAKAVTPLKSDVGPEPVVADKGSSDAPVQSEGPDWIGIKNSYCGSKLTVAQICAVFRITKTQLYDRRRTEKWPSRSERRCDGKTSGVAASRIERPVVPKGRAALRKWRGGMISRLYAAMDRQLAEIERQQCGDETISGAERERQTRQMNVLTRSMEKLADVHEQEDRRRKNTKRANSTKQDATHRDAETWRLEIARRITRIREKWFSDETFGDS